jgi:RNA-binding protein YhbY
MKCTSHSILLITIAVTVCNGFAPSLQNFQNNRLNQISRLKMNNADDEAEKAWRYIKKPLLRIGGKGVADSHGNSLRELLQAHTCVKVKVNTDKMGSLEEAYEVIREVTEKNGNIKCELIQCRDAENTILIGKEGAWEMIRAGTYPPPKEERQEEIL